MVLGHTNCGAVDATIKVVKENAKLPGHLPGLVRAIKPAVEAAKKADAADLLDAAITENVRYNVARLNKAKPIVSAFVADGKAKVVGARYDLATGKVSLV
jgi:carbonic anhydrase